MVFVLALDADQVAELARQHVDSQYRLHASVGAPIVAHVNGDPRKLVGELLRLAFIGAAAEAAAQADGPKSAHDVVRTAHLDWRSL
jgi:hypothetical protein